MSDFKFFAISSGKTFFKEIKLKGLDIDCYYEKLDNGNYYVRLSNGNELYIPATISSDQSLLAYAPGSGGSRNDATHLRTMCESATPPSCVVAISSSCSDNYDILGMGTNAINSLGGQVNNVVYASFSASGIKGLQQGEAYLQNNPNVSYTSLHIWT